MSEPEIIVRPTAAADVAELATLLNEIIAIGGTTAYEEAFNPDAFATEFLTGDHVIASYAAQQGKTGDLVGFQVIVHKADLPDGWADIATFARMTPKIPGVGRALFGITASVARRLGFSVINATIRADNCPGLGFYDRMGFITYRTIPAMPLCDGTPVDRVRKRFDLN